MRVRWFGQSAFALQGAGSRVFVDPFGDMSAAAARGIQWEYPAIEGESADLVIVTHEHFDHNAVEVIGGEPQVLRSTAGTFDSPVGQVLAAASEHDEQAGTQRGPNTIVCFELEGIRVCHFGDFGQRGLREEQAQALGGVELLFLPVGGGPTIGAEQASLIVQELAPRWVVPMHYRTARIGFLEPAEDFLSHFQRVQPLEVPEFDTAALPSGDGPLVVVPAAP